MHQQRFVHSVCVVTTCCIVQPQRRVSADSEARRGRAGGVSAPPARLWLVAAGADLDLVRAWIVAAILCLRCATAHGEGQHCHHERGPDSNSKGLHHVSLVRLKMSTRTTCSARAAEVASVHSIAGSPGLRLRTSGGRQRGPRS